MSRPSLSQFLRYAEMKRQDERRREALAYAGQAWLQGVTNSIPKSEREALAMQEDKPLAYSHRPLTTNYLVSQRDEIGISRAKRGNVK